jgi:hypothetical protein
MLLILSLNALPQADSTVLSKNTDRHALYAGAGYGNNMIYLGSTISQDLPFGYGALSYILGGELSLTGSAFYLPALEPSAPAFSSISLSYNHDFTKWLDIAAGVYRYMVKPSLTDTLFGNFNYADLTLGLDWKILYTEVSYGGFLVKDPPAYLQVKNSRYFETPSFFNGKANVSFYPYANLLFGNLTMSETWNGTEIITTTQTLVTPVSLAGSQGSGNGQGSGAGSGQGAGTGTGSSTTTTTTTTTEIPTTNTVYSEKFNLIEMEIGLPVTINFDFMSFEADLSYVFPTYSDPDYPAPKGFVFMFSAYFKIF